MANLRIGEEDAAPDLALDQVDAGHLHGQIGALGEVVGGGSLELHAELEGQGILAEDVGEALHFALGGGKEGDAAALGGEAAGFLDGGLHVVAEGHAGAGRDFEGRERGVQFAGEAEFADLDFAAVGVLGLHLAPVAEEQLWGARRLIGETVEAFPEAVGGDLEGLGLIPDHDGAGQQFFERSVAGRR